MPIVTLNSWACVDSIVTMAAGVSAQESAFLREKKGPSVVLKKCQQVPQHSGIQSNGTATKADHFWQR
jgi:hypothetical protein